MTRVIFLRELSNLNNDLIKMGIILEKTIDLMLQTLEKLDIEIAKEVIDRDDIIDSLEYKIEEECIELIVKQQPIASDLRSVTGIMKMVTDIERIADNCSDISEYIILLNQKEYVNAPENLIKMAKIVKEMTVATIECFVSKNTELLENIIKKDDIVDEYFVEIKNEISEKMQQNSNIVPQYIDYLMILKYLERMADHTTNIAEWIRYIILGDLPVS